MKRSVLTDGRGVPLSGVIAGANRNDHLLMPDTLDAVPVPRPEPTPDHPQHLCLDKGDDNPSGHEAVEEHGYVNHIRPIGEDRRGKRRRGRRKARRWVVEIV